MGALGGNGDGIGETVDDALGIGDFETDGVGSWFSERFADLWTGAIVEEAVSIQIPVILRDRSGCAVGV